MKRREDRLYIKSISISVEDKTYIRNLHKLPEYEGYGDAGILSDIIKKHSHKNQGKLL